MPRKHKRNKASADDLDSAAPGVGGSKAAKSKAKQGKRGLSMPAELIRGDRTPTELSDTESEFSHLSLDDDLESVVGEAKLDEEEDASENLQQVLETKITENLENATHKNTSVRLAALKILQGVLSRYYIPELLDKWKATFLDVVEKSLRKGNLEENKVSVRIGALLAVQLGNEVSSEIGKLLTILKPNCTDPSLNFEFRADCAVVTGVCCFLAQEELEPILQVLDSLRSVWTGVKAGSHQTDSDSAHLFSAFLSSWGMLLSQVPQRRVEEILAQDLPKLCVYLDSNQVEIRIAAGETLALLYELGAELHGNFRPPNHFHLLDTLQALSTDSVKYRAKRDRRMQRCSFRQIHSAIKEGEELSLKIKFDQEVLLIESWTEKLIYDTFCRVLRGGINFHLKQNTLLRDTFDLGPPQVKQLSRSERKFTKLEQQLDQQRKAKDRCQLRGRQRNKRVASFSGS